MLQGFEIKFQIYAENEAEAEEARKAIVGFINQHAMSGRAVSATKIVNAVSKWDSNPLIKSKIIEYFT
jgi:hypothetical protein